MELYVRKQLAQQMLKKVLIHRPVTKNELLVLLLEKFGLSAKFLNEFFILYSEQIDGNENEGFIWVNSVK